MAKNRGDLRKLKALEDLLALYPEWRSSEEDDEQRIETYLSAATDIDPALYEQACRRLIASRRREDGRPLPGDVWAVADRLKAEEKRHETSTRPSEFEFRQLVLADIRSGARRWYLENVINSTLEQYGAEPIPVPDWPTARPDEIARWEIDYAPVKAEYAALVFSNLPLARAIGKVVVPGISRDLIPAVADTVSL